METLFAFIIMFAMLFGGVIGVGLLFRWFIKRTTGYDIWYFHGMHHEYLKAEVDFAQLTDWDHETGFVACNDNRKRTSRKAKATPHYDRLYAMEQAQNISDAEKRLATQNTVDNDEVMSIE